MRLRTLLLRSACVLALAVWVGGLAVYGAVVLPTLHRLFGVPASSAVTRHVTDVLNLIGAAGLALWWAEFSTDRGARLRRTRLGLLATTSALLAVQLVLHRAMDRRLDAGTRQGFYPLHRAYLLASTAHWFADLGLVTAALSAWGERPGRDGAGVDRGEGGPRPGKPPTRSTVDLDLPTE